MPVRGRGRTIVERTPNGLVPGSPPLVDRLPPWYTRNMAGTTTQTLDRLLEPVTRCLNSDALSQLVNLRADADLQARLELLANKNTEGLLTDVERDEYETYVRAISVISILQAQARNLLAVQKAS